MKEIKLLLADDQKLFVESLRNVLETRAKDIEVVGIAKNGREAVEMCARMLPNVVLMDVCMPEMNGVESTKIIRAKYPSTRILILTTFYDDEYVVEALRLGAIGYLLKDMSPTELINAIRTVYEGGVLVSSKVAAKLSEKLMQTSMAKGKTDNPPELPVWFNELSYREKEILFLLAQGYENKKIAEHLHVAEQTVKNYVSSIYSKLGVKDRVQASLMVIETGLDFHCIFRRKLDSNSGRKRTPIPGQTGH